MHRRRSDNEQKRKQVAMNRPRMVKATIEPGTINQERSIDCQGSQTIVGLGDEMKWSKAASSHF